MQKRRSNDIIRLDGKLAQKKIDGSAFAAIRFENAHLIVPNLVEPNPVSTDR